MISHNNDDLNSSVAKIWWLHQFSEITLLYSMYSFKERNVPTSLLGNVIAPPSCYCTLNNPSLWSGWLTAKCDVYSFGVVLLELLSGRRAIDKTKVGVEQNLVDWAKPYLGDRRKLFRIMDTKLEGQYPQKAAYATAVIASQCISEAKLRPQMPEVLAILEQLPVAKYANSPTSSLSPKSPLRKSHPSLLNMSPRRSPLPSSQMQSPVLKSPRGRWAGARFSNRLP